MNNSEKHDTDQSSPNPLGLSFHRLAARRFVFDNNLPLCEMNPPTVVALDLMHPYESLENGSGSHRQMHSFEISQGKLKVTNSDEQDSASRLLVGGFNPYAVYDVAVDGLSGNGEVGIEFGTQDPSKRFVFSARYNRNEQAEVRCRYQEGGVERLSESLTLEQVPAFPFTFRVQMMGTGIGVYLEKDGVSRLQGVLETNTLLDFRKLDCFRQMKFYLFSRLTSGSSVIIRNAMSYFSCGVGQADIRLVTCKDGTPYVQDDRLWFLFTTRGWKTEHTTQGVFSLNPSLFDPRFEGVIVFDMDDGKLRNDIGTHLYYDEEERQWRGWGCNFSTVADGSNTRAASGINYVWSDHNPLKGYSVMRSRAADNLSDHHEDPCGVWDAKAGRWRLVLSSFQESDIRASMWESENWDGPFTKIAGPVPRDSTGTLIQKIGDTPYVFAASADRALYVYSYPDLGLLGELSTDYTPWNDTVKNGRVWPNIFPAPPGHPYPYLALMMDRANYPKLGGWTYGALYLYGAVPSS